MFHQFEDCESNNYGFVSLGSHVGGIYFFRLEMSRCTSASSMILLMVGEFPSLFAEKVV